MKKNFLNLFILFIFLSLNLFSEVINEKIFDNPSKEITSIETKKNRDKANLNIVVNKIIPMKINGVIENNTLLIPLNHKLLDNIDNSYFIILKSLKEISNIVGNNKLINILRKIDKSNFQEIDFNKQILKIKTLNKYSSENLYVCKINLLNNSLDSIFQIDSLKKDITFHNSGNLNIYVDSSVSGLYIRVGDDMGTAYSWHDFNNPSKTHPLLYYKNDNINIDGKILEVLSINDRNDFYQYFWYSKTYDVYSDSLNSLNWKHSIMYPRQEYQNKDDFFNELWVSMNNNSFKFKVRTDSPTKPYQMFTININSYERNIYHGIASLNLKDLPNNSWAGWNPEVTGHALADFKEYHIARTPVLDFTSSNLFNTMGVSNKSILDKLTITSSNGSRIIYDNIQNNYFKNNERLTHSENNFDLHFTSDGKFFVTKKNEGTYNENLEIQAQYIDKDLGSLNLTITNEEFIIIDLPNTLDFGDMKYDPKNNYLKAENIFQINNINNLNLSFSLKKDTGEMVLINNPNENKIPLSEIKLEYLGKNDNNKVEFIKISACAELNKALTPGNYQGTIDLIINIE